MTGGERWNYRHIRQRDWDTFNGIILVYNYCLRETFDKLDEWLNCIREKTSKDCVILLAGYRYVHEYMTDDRKVTFGEGQEFAERNGLAFMETLDQSIIDNKFRELVTNVHKVWKDKCKVERAEQPEIDSTIDEVAQKDKVNSTSNGCCLL